MNIIVKRRLKINNYKDMKDKTTKNTTDKKNKIMLKSLIDTIVFAIIIVIMWVAFVMCIPKIKLCGSKHLFELYIIMGLCILIALCLIFSIREWNRINKIIENATEIKNKKENKLENIAFFIVGLIVVIPVILLCGDKEVFGIALRKPIVFIILCLLVYPFEKVLNKIKRKKHNK